MTKFNVSFEEVCGEITLQSHAIQWQVFVSDAPKYRVEALKIIMEPKNFSGLMTL